MVAIELDLTVRLHQRCFSRRCAIVGSSMIGSEKVEIPTAVVCIGTTITKLAIVRPDVKCYSIKKLLSHFTLVLK